MRIHQFLPAHLETILIEWEEEVRSQAPPAWKLSRLALRDHAPSLLKSIAGQLEHAGDPAGLKTSAKKHGGERLQEGFDAAQIGAEYNALRSVIVRQWRGTIEHVDESSLDDLDKFDAALNHALAISLSEYSANLSRSKDTFIAILGHDLRTPLGAVSMGADFLATRSPAAADPSTRPVIEGIVRSAARMRGMIKDLLAYTSKQLGNEMPITVEETDISAVCRAAVDEARLAYPGSRFVLETEGALDGLFDGGRLQQLLSNLLVNAVQHGENRAPVKVAAYTDQDDVVIQVRNIGPVIPPHALERIFDPLVRYAAEHPGEEEAYLSTSLGLGLYIARAIAQAHGGTIDVASNEEDGTTFTVRLPLRTSAAPGH
jgi:signal transduction histidine kinase